MGRSYFVIWAGGRDGNAEVTSSPCHLLSRTDHPEVTPAIAFSPVQFVDAMCRSMLRQRSKQRSMGAAIRVVNSMRTIRIRFCRRKQAVDFGMRRRTVEALIRS